MRILFFFLVFCFLGLSGVGLAQKRKIVKTIEAMEEALGNHSGFYLYDPGKEKVLIDYKGARYFTPASNTKIFTLYASLKMLGDSIPGIYYRESKDSLIIWGTGDPSLYYENVPYSAVDSFLRNKEGVVYLSDRHFYDRHFGEAWAWDDYSFSFQVEKAPFPLFGNYYYLGKEKGKRTLQITNNSFKKYFQLKDSLLEMPPVIRDYGSNRADYYPRERDEEFKRKIPFKYSNELAAEMLGDTLNLAVRPVNMPLPSERKVIYSVPSDSLYKVLMQASDNFIAEQLMLLVSGVATDSLNTRMGIDYIKENFLSDLPDEPLWIDGSGLSRYNQFTPRSIVKLWGKIYEEFGEDRIFPLLATGGVNGTIKNWYGADEPFVFGKTGTLRNHHSLSGYLKTDKGSVLIFSFMHGHYPGPSSSVKGVMERILLKVKERY